MLRQEPAGVARARERVRQWRAEGSVPLPYVEAWERHLAAPLEALCAASSTRASGPRAPAGHALRGLRGSPDPVAHLAGGARAGGAGVNRAQLEHVIRASAMIVEDDEIIVIGSQSVLVPRGRILVAEADRRGPTSGEGGSGDPRGPFSTRARAKLRCGPGSGAIGAGPAGLLAHVERHQLVGGRQVALGGVVHLVAVVEALGVPAEQARGEAQRIALAHLAHEGQVRLQAERGDLAFPPVGAIEADEVHPGVGGEVEHHQVVAHVHVPVVVDPLRAHDVAIDVERRGDLGHGAHARIASMAWVLASGPPRRGLMMGRARPAAR